MNYNDLRSYVNTYKNATKHELVKRIEDRSSLLSELDKICATIPHEAKLNDLTYAYINHVYNRLDQNKSHTASALGISLRAVRYYFNTHQSRLENKKR